MLLQKEATILAQAVATWAGLSLLIDPKPNREAMSSGVTWVPSGCPLARPVITDTSFKHVVGEISERHSSHVRGSDSLHQGLELHRGERQHEWST